MPELQALSAPAVMPLMAAAEASFKKPLREIFFIVSDSFLLVGDFSVLFVRYYTNKYGSNFHRISKGIFLGV